MKLVTSETMQNWEKNLVQLYQIPTQLLMENAGKSVTEFISRFMKEKKWNQIAVVCGPGNNGGDGLVIARHLSVRFPQMPLTIFFVGNPDRLKKDPLVNYEVCQRIGITITQVTPETLPVFTEKTLIIDALFGTGLSKRVEGIYEDVIQLINQADDAFIVSVDVPSGVDASWGKVMGVAVKAHHTVTFGMMKRGLMVAPAREYAGSIHLVDIGIPFERNELNPPQDGFLITPDLIRPHLPEKTFYSNKISAGVTLIVAGSPSMTGAGLLTCHGAYRSGAGMVIWATNQELAPLIKIFIPEVVSSILPSNNTTTAWRYLPHHVDAIIQAIQDRKCRSLAIGPGLGSHPSTRFFIEKLIEKTPVKGVIDADALNSISKNRERWKNQLQGWVLTPHEGEISRLLGCPVSSVTENRISASCALTQYFGCVTVLKGPGTIVVSPEGEIAINPTGNANLATAGSGDVLTGVIASLIAQGNPPFISAITGVFLHGLAADLLQNQYHQFLANDIALYIPHAIKVVKNGEYRLSVVDGN